MAKINGFTANYFFVGTTRIFFAGNDLLSRKVKWISEKLFFGAGNSNSFCRERFAFGKSATVFQKTIFVGGLLKYFLPEAICFREKLNGFPKNYFFGQTTRIVFAGSDLLSRKLKRFSEKLFFWGGISNNFCRKRFAFAKSEIVFQKTIQVGGQLKSSLEKLTKVAIFEAS